MEGNATLYSKTIFRKNTIPFYQSSMEVVTVRERILLNFLIPVLQFKELLHIWLMMKEYKEGLDELLLFNFISLDSCFMTKSRDRCICKY